MHFKAILRRLPSSPVEGTSSILTNCAGAAEERSSTPTPE
jgi:hypothetical protein